MKNIILFSAVFASAVCSAALPKVSQVSMSQDFTRTVTVKYYLAGAPAVITLDVQTNSQNWASIGGAALDKGTNATPNVQGAFVKVTADGWHEIKWQPLRSWGDAVRKFPAGEMRAVVKAWAPDDTPDYMAVDLRESLPAGFGNRVRYYPSEDLVPGGVLSNEVYRRTTLLLRRIRAKNVPWTMGGTDWDAVSAYRAAEQRVSVTLDHDYYIGVFEITQQQWQTVCGNNPSYYKVDGDMRPCDQVSYARLREKTYDAAASDENKLPDPAYAWPADPNPDSFLGKLRARADAGIDFDLPGDAQWEFAARAGLSEGYWNNGKILRFPGANKTVNTLYGDDMPGRNQSNGGWLPGDTTYPPSTIGATNGTAIVGSYAPNAWGLYDMHGNLFEFCLDFYQEDVYLFCGRINANGTADLNGNTMGENCMRVRRSGCFHYAPTVCRFTVRDGCSQKDAYVTLGGRVACRAGLK